VSEDQAYKGNASSGNGGNDFNALDFMIQQALVALSTATYVQIVTPPYDASGAAIEAGTAGPIGFVDVQPLVNQLDGYGKAVPHGTVYRLKYHRYGSGSGAFIADPVKDDIGIMVVSDRDLSVVKSTEAQGNPGSRRMMDKADGTYFGCPIQGTPSQFFAWLSEGFKLVDAFGNTIIGTSNGVEINGALIDQNGDVITKKGVDLDNHTHNQGVDSHGDTEQPTDPPNTGS